jgi:hypothetical protein
MIDFTFFPSLENTIRLSRQMSNYHLTHGIRNFIEDFDTRIYNNVEHQNLYMLDLHCSYSIEMLRQVKSTIDYLCISQV